METFKVLLCCLFISTFSAFSQNQDVNQTDEDGNKFGLWKIYHENGKVKSRGMYEILKKDMSVEELFMIGVTRKIKETVSVKNGEWLYFNINENKIKKEEWNYGRLLWYEKFNYEGKKLKNVEKVEVVKSFKAVPKISINPKRFALYGRVGNTQNIQFIYIHSEIDKRVPIKYKSGTNSILFIENHSFVEPKQKIAIPFKVDFKLARSSDHIEISYFNEDTVDVIIGVTYTGYDISAEDFSLTKAQLDSFKLNNNVICFYRGSEECELKIYPYYNDANFEKIKNYEVKETAIYPLSLEFNEIDLSHFPKDRYLFRIVNYRDKIDRFAIINLE